MHTIVEGNKEVIRLLGAQQIKCINYRLMKYVLKARCQEGTLLHNVITGQMVLLSDEEQALVSSLPAMYTYSMTKLIERFFLVPLDYSEKTTVDKLRLMMRHLFTPPGCNGYVIFTTTDCNARCFYCFENGCQRITMSESVGEKLIEYMIAHKGNGKLDLRWFGGEPLIGHKRIDQICMSLKSQGVSYDSSIVSNGYLFTEQMVKKAVSLWRLKQVQITLDGTEHIYNKVKSYVGVKESPYQRVLNNINILLDNGIKVNIRLNLDKHNKENLFELVEELGIRFKDRSLLNIYVYVIEKDIGGAPITRTEEEDFDLYKQQQRISRHLDRLGFIEKLQKLPSLKTVRCMADSNNSMVIYPNGYIYKCEHVMERDWVGHICLDTLDAERIKKFDEHLQRDVCDECNLYPDCILLKKCPVSGTVNSFICETKKIKS